jgi:hypothetical protein
MTIRIREIICLGEYLTSAYICRLIKFVSLVLQKPGSGNKGIFYFNSYNFCRFNIEKFND